ncbi:hypothetical protein PVK06_001808 [Gossypium arboreum]|uniref:CCHC-type domain-containing protein n=1 Tax=Gossypium arboreum TaxID=29729 RepID=A0ABR0R332_GOSAR|nr:hypothetical protein PVK06_001808 [Gossypium arboreum]
MAIYVNLDKLLVSQVTINDTIQRVEFESLPVVCFACGRYGHMKEVCSRHGLEVSLPDKKDVAEETTISTMTEIQHAEETTADGPWMLGLLCMSGLGPMKKIGQRQPKPGEEKASG